MGRWLARVGVTLVLVSSACGGGGDDGADNGDQPTTTFDMRPLADRVESFPNQSRFHTQSPVTYAQTPPVGGDHFPVWQNCGFYSMPVQPELAVHSLEHGAVWIAFRPNLSQPEVAQLRALARANPYVLVSPWADNTLPAPVIASAWGVQLKAGGAADPGLRQFVSTYAGGLQAPEPGALCTNGFGTPG